MSCNPIFTPYGFILIIQLNKYQFNTSYKLTYIDALETQDPAYLQTYILAHPYYRPVPLKFSCLTVGHRNFKQLNCSNTSSFSCLVNYINITTYIVVMPILNNNEKYYYEYRKSTLMRSMGSWYYRYPMLYCGFMQYQYQVHFQCFNHSETRKVEEEKRIHSNVHLSLDVIIILVPALSVYHRFYTA